MGAQRPAPHIPDALQLTIRTAASLPRDGLARCSALFCWANWYRQLAISSPGAFKGCD